jgi:HIRAN domain-containing protein
VGSFQATRGAETSRHQAELSGPTIGKIIGVALWGKIKRRWEIFAPPEVRRHGKFQNALFVGSILIVGSIAVAVAGVASDPGVLLTKQGLATAGFLIGFIAFFSGVIWLARYEAKSRYRQALRRPSFQEPGIVETEVVASNGPHDRAVSSEYQQHLAGIAGSGKRGGVSVAVDALLYREFENEDDPTAIAVFIAERGGAVNAVKVGYVPSSIAAEMAPAIDRNIKLGQVVVVEGIIRGGHSNDSGVPGVYTISIAYWPEMVGL